jgi:hypothetical protein
MWHLWFTTWMKPQIKSEGSFRILGAEFRGRPGVGFRVQPLEAVLSIYIDVVLAFCYIFVLLTPSAHLPPLYLSAPPFVSSPLSLSLSPRATAVCVCGYVVAPPPSPRAISLCPLFQLGYTALIYASRSGHAKVVKLLLAAGADKNLQDGVSPPPTSPEIERSPLPTPCIHVHSHPQRAYSGCV